MKQCNTLRIVLTASLGISEDRSSYWEVVAVVICLNGQLQQVLCVVIEGMTLCQIP